MNSSGGADGPTEPVSGDGLTYPVDPLSSPGAPGWHLPPISPMPPILPEQTYGPPGYPPPRRTGFAAFWNHPGVIAGIMGSLVLLITALAVVAITALRAKAPAANAGGGAATATGRPTGTDKTTPAADNSSPAGKATTSAPESSTFLNGSIGLYYYSGNPQGVDFDSAKSGQVRYDFAPEEKVDVEINATSLDAKNHAGVHKWTGSGQPDQAGCATGAQWAPSMHVSTLAPDVVICFQTSDGRIGALTLTDVKKNDAGQLTNLGFDYVVWKKQGDQ